jgi:hypothetical protein
MQVSRSGVVTGLFWIHVGVAVVLMVVLLGLVDLDHNETLTSPSPSHSTA